MRLDSGIGRKERLEGRSLPRTLSWNSLVLLLLLFLPAGAYAKQVTLAWDDPNAEGVVEGYQVYYRTGGSGERVLPSYDGLGLTHQGADFPSGSSVPQQDPPVTTVTCTVDGLSDTETYYFVVTAFNVYGESDASNETSTADNAPTAAISRTPASLSASCTQGTNASSQSFQVSNSGGGTLDYTISDDVSWLSVSPATESSTGESDTITVDYSTSGLSAGSHSATITIAATGATNTPQTIPVTLTVGSTASESSGGGGGGGCWIATAADGENVPQRRLLFVLIGSGGAVLVAVVGGRRVRWRSEKR